MLQKTKEKIRLAHIGLCPSDETKTKMRESHLGLFAGNKHPNWGKRGGHHSEYTREKMSEKRKQLYEKGLLPCYVGELNPNWGNGEKIQGENNPNWKGGVYASERAKDMRQAKYKHWRRKVLERDNFTCVICRRVGGRLNSHHIKSWVDYPEKRYDVNNSITLCEDCHKDVHRDEIDCLQYLEIE